MNTYTVQTGDTLSIIAGKLGISMAALESANPQISDPNLIYAGESINIPASSNGSSQTVAVSSGSGFPVWVYYGLGVITLFTAGYILYRRSKS